MTPERLNVILDEITKLRVELESVAYTSPAIREVVALLCAVEEKLSNYCALIDIEGGG